MLSPDRYLRDKELIQCEMQNYTARLQAINELVINLEMALSKKEDYWGIHADIEILEEEWARLEDKKYATSLLMERVKRW